MSKKRYKILVTGCGGYIGSNFCYWVKKNHPEVQIQGLDIKSDGPEDKYLDDFIQLDITKLNAWQEGLDFESLWFDPDAVFHFAAKSIVSESNNNKPDYFNTNVGGVIHLLKYMLWTNCERIVFASSAAVYTEPKSNYYGSTKRIAENAIMHTTKLFSNLDYTILRYFNVAGQIKGSGIKEQHEPETHLIPNVFNDPGNVKIYGDGRNVRDYVHIEDVCRITWNTFDVCETFPKKSLLCDIGTGFGTSTLRVVERIKELTKLPISYTILENEPRIGDADSLIAQDFSSTLISNGISENLLKTQYNLDDIILSMVD